MSLSSATFRIQAQIRENRQTTVLDTRRENQGQMTASTLIPIQGPSLPINEQVARIEKNSPELITDVRLPAKEELIYGPDKMTEGQTVSLLASIVEKTQHALIVNDRSLCKHLAQIYQELGENRRQIEQLTNLLEQSPGRKVRRLPTTSTIENDVENDILEVDAQFELFEDCHSDTAEIFFDCVSRFSQDRSDGSIDRLRSTFSGTPDSFFESTSTFFPEQYTTEGLFNEPTAVLAMVDLNCTNDRRFQKYFLIHAETPRRWKRVTVLANISCISKHSVFSHLSAPDFLEHSCKTLPGDLQSQLDELFRSRDLLETITSVSLHVREDIQGQLSIDTPNVLFAEDLQEIEMCSGEDQLQDIEDLGCAQYLESEVIIQSRISSSAYIVWVESQNFIERKLPFAGAGWQGQNGVEDFFEDLKLSYSMRECACVVRFIGVVLDDTRKHLKSYLYESPTLGTAQQMLETAEAKAEKIPWSIRETWAKQIVTAVSEVHSKGFVVGVLQLDSIGIRADGSAVLTALKSSGRHIPNRRGYVPPELRSKPGSNFSPKKMNFRTDIFQLGFILWLLAEHKSTVCGYYCIRNGCTTVPRYSCTADHTNPVSLPPCLNEVPAYFSEIINNCRASNPKARPPARELLALFPQGGEMTSSSPEMAELGTKYPLTDSVRFSVNCDECGGLTTDLHYHCNICNLADFDICQICVAQGIHCFVPEHRPTKRVLTNGSIVNSA